MNAYTIRIDYVSPYSEEFHEETLTDFLSKYEKYIVFKEISAKKGKLHWQGVVFTNQIHNTYRTKANAHFDHWKGHQRRSFAEVGDVEKYMPYIFKDGNQRIQKGFTEEELNAWRVKSIAISNDIAIKRAKAVSFSHKIVQDFDEWFSNQPKEASLVNYPNFDEDVSSDDELDTGLRSVRRKIEQRETLAQFQIKRKKLVCRWVLDYFNTHTKVFDSFIINRFVNLLIYRYFPDYRDTMVDKIINQTL